MSVPLSSRWTPFYKFALPFLVIGGIGVAAWQAYVHPERQQLPAGMDPANGWMLVAAVGVVAGAFIWWTIKDLARVELDDDELIISDYRTEIRVPLARVASISGPSWSNPPRYTLRFDEPTEFGRRVTFLAPMQWTLMRLSEPEEVRELRSAWDAMRRTEAPRRR